MTTLSPDELEDEGLAVADEYEEAARYQTAQILTGSGYTDAQFREATDRLASTYRSQRMAVGNLRAPANPAWSFDRRDAYFLTAEGGEPVTETGRRDWELLLKMPLIMELL